MVEIEDALRTRKIPIRLVEEAAELRLKFSGVSQIGIPNTPEEITFATVNDRIDMLHTQVIDALHEAAQKKSA